jgi:LytS/YehU family sensor histidine kinase
LGSLGAVSLVEPEFTAKAVWQSIVYAFFEWLVLGGAATFIYTDRRRAKKAVARMRAAEIERRQAAKRTLESHLQALQARVEPQFLFNTLAQVKKLYTLDSASGERMLDQLIAYLRAAMPKMRDTSSTLGQELELARAYLAIVKLRLGDRLSYEIESVPEAREARMPPMLLLPLIDHAIVHGLAEPATVAALSLRAEVAEGNLRVQIADRRGSFRPEGESEGLDGIRERLAALYGTEASLVLRSMESGATEAVLEIPRAEDLGEPGS